MRESSTIESNWFGRCNPIYLCQSRETCISYFVTTLMGRIRSHELLSKYLFKHNIELQISGRSITLSCQWSESNCSWSDNQWFTVNKSHSVSCILIEQLIPNSLCAVVRKQSCQGDPEMMKCIQNSNWNMFVPLSFTRTLFFTSSHVHRLTLKHLQANKTIVWLVYRTDCIGIKDKVRSCSQQTRTQMCTNTARVHAFQR